MFLGVVVLELSEGVHPPFFEELVVAGELPGDDFAAVLGVNLGMANITPPTAPLLFLGARVTRTSVNVMIKPTLIMIVFAWLPTLMLTTFVPSVALWLPDLMFSR